MSLKFRFASTIRCKINRILKLDHFVNYYFSKNNFLNDLIAYVNERSTIKANISRTVRDADITRSTFGEINVFFHSPKFDRNRGSHCALLPDQNLSSNRGQGYSPQTGIALTNAWFFPSVYQMKRFIDMKRSPLSKFLLLSSWIVFSQLSYNYTMRFIG